MVNPSLRAAFAAVMGASCVLGGCIAGEVVGSAVQALAVCPETVSPDERGDPRNADERVRLCWPGEAHCYCDSDDDCYAEPGYIACTPPTDAAPADAGAPQDVVTPKAPPPNPDPPPGPDPPPDPGPPPGETVGPALPTFDALTVAHVRDLTARGASRGNSRQVVAKIGDSITESASFLMDCGHGWYDLGAYANLEDTLGYFSARTLPGGENSLARSSLCATAGWTTADALEGGDPGSPLARELDAIRPQWAIVMFGTNDLDRVSVATFRGNLGRVVDLIESRAVVTVLSTIPPRFDTATASARVAGFNDAVRGLAGERHLPLLDYWAGLQSLPGQGVSSDGVHPNALHGSDACIFTTEGLRYGYNLRSLTAIQMFARLRAY